MISILLPFYNASPWIQETVESIQQQSYQDWELIAIDDDYQTRFDARMLVLKERFRVHPADAPTPVEI